MSRHAPLYGVGLEALSPSELETLSRIHEDGLRQIHSIQQRKASPAGSPLLSPLSRSHSPHALYPSNTPPPPPPPAPVGPIVPNGGVHNSNGHVNSAVGSMPWFNNHS